MLACQATPLVTLVVVQMCKNICHQLGKSKLLAGNIMPFHGTPMELALQFFHLPIFSVFL